MAPTKPPLQLLALTTLIAGHGPNSLRWWAALFVAVLGSFGETLNHEEPLGSPCLGTAEELGHHSRHGASPFDEELPVGRAGTWPDRGRRRGDRSGHARTSFAPDHWQAAKDRAFRLLAPPRAL